LVAEVDATTGMPNTLAVRAKATALFRRTCLSSEPNTEGEASLKIDQQQCAIFGTQERGIGKHLDTYFGWPVTESTDMRVV
jgi:hypothetical protein